MVKKILFQAHIMTRIINTIKNKNIHQRWGITALKFSIYLTSISSPYKGSKWPKIPYNPNITLYRMSISAAVTHWTLMLSSATVLSIFLGNICVKPFCLEDWRGFKLSSMLSAKMGSCSQSQPADKCSFHSSHSFSFSTPQSESHRNVVWGLSSCHIRLQMLAAYLHFHSFPRKRNAFSKMSHVPQAHGDTEYKASCIKMEWHRNS